MSRMRQDPPQRSGPSHWSREYVPGSFPIQGDDPTVGWNGQSLSVIVPAKNEARSLPKLIEEVVRALRPLTGKRPSGAGLSRFEIIVVDDGSTDATPEVLRRLCEMYPELRPVHLSRNVGQSAAITVGFRWARGGWVATLDADLQNDPADLTVLWDALPGFDAALGWRVKREDVWTKRVLSHWANRVRNRVLGQSIRDTGCSVRIFPRALALRLPMFHGGHRFLGPLMLREGCSIVQKPVNHRPRSHGVSHYTLWNRSLRVFVDLIGVAWLLRRPICCEVVPWFWGGDDTAMSVPSSRVEVSSAVSALGASSGPHTPGWNREVA